MARKLSKKSTQIAVIDFETDPFKYGQNVAPFCCGYYDTEEYLHFWGDDCVTRLIDFLKTKEKRIIYAHNGGKFDFFFMLDFVDEEIKIINGRIAKCTILDGLHEMRDSYLILPMPLKSHGKKSISYRKMRKEFREKYKKEILDYLYYDCFSLFDWVTSFIADYGNGLTLAGAAFKQLKKTEYPVQNTYDDYDSLFREFYFGGRVQCFEVGAFIGKFKYVDINSAYPYAMTFKHWQGSMYSQVLCLPKDPQYFAEIEAISLGALPIKDESGRLIFPSDNVPRIYKVSGWEIQAGIETNTLTIKKVINCYKPLFTCDFKPYVNKFFQLKSEAEKNGDNTRRTFAKLMLNSAYGKFGQNGRDFEDFALCESGGYPEGEGWVPYSRNEESFSIYSKPAPVDRFYNVATAASITGFVRAFLWRNICASSRPLYCDTDAIICESFSGEVGDKLGQWDVEFEPTECYIAQKKMYALKDEQGNVKKACKGVRLKFNQIKNGVLNRENLEFKKPSPAFSLKYGTRFFSRVIDFENID